ncbi:polysaccharide deacetylase family protein [Sunxiuqinia dokdonensis]|nr:polysaccharide deacetylase family protein [Sunxiuqinia dokdonensis]
MKILSQMISLAARPFSLAQLSAGDDVPVLLPFYHLVSDHDHPFQYNYRVLSTKRFREDLDFLLAYFEPITLEELHSGMNLKNCFHLSFDDGLRQCFDVIAPILKEKGVPATFFVNPAFVDNHDLFHRYKAAVLNQFFAKKGVMSDLQNTYADLMSLDQMAEDVGLDWQEYLQKENPYMTLEQLSQLERDGFTIGAHSWDHPEFWLLDEASQLDEIRESMEWLGANFSPKIKAFAFPFTDFGVSPFVFDAIRRERLCDLTFGTAGIKFEKETRHHQRLPMERAGYKTARDLLKAEYLSYQLKRLVDQHVAKRE